MQKLASNFSSKSQPPQDKCPFSDLNCLTIGCPTTLPHPQTTSSAAKTHMKLRIRKKIRQIDEGSPVVSENQSPISAIAAPHPTEPAETRTPRNLRPRKRNSVTDSIVAADSTWLRNFSETRKRAAEKKKKRNEERKKQSFSIGLTDERIKADILAITGGKPLERSKKRSKEAQRLLDERFPGLGLDSIANKSYLDNVPVRRS